MFTHILDFIAITKSVTKNKTYKKSLFRLTYAYGVI